jgi:hypothetical protein
MGLFRSSVPPTVAARRKLWADFSRDPQTQALQITPEELRRLHTIFMLSGLSTRGELLTALNRIRWRP